MTRAKTDGFTVEFMRRHHVTPTAAQARGREIHETIDREINADRLADALRWMTAPTTRDAAVIIAIAQATRRLGMSNDAIDRANAYRIATKRGEPHKACAIATHVVIEAHAIATASAVRAMASGATNTNAEAGR